jgi:hypothetical protein
MEQHELPNEPRDELESLANAPPTRVERIASSAAGFVTATLALGAIGLGTGLFLREATTTRCAGATRSTKLQWQQRQLEMDQAADAAQSGVSQQTAPDISPGA